MAKTVKKDSTSKKAKTQNPEAKKKKLKQYKLVFGILLILLSLALLLAFVSFYIYGTQDQSTLTVFEDRSENTRNWLGKVGAYIADLFIFKGFGVASFLFVKLLFITGLSIVLDVSLNKLKLIWFWDLFAMIIISIFCGFFASSLPELGGTVGYEISSYLQDYLGYSGTIIVLIFSLLLFIVAKFELSTDKVGSYFEKKKEDLKARMPVAENAGEAYNLEEFAVDENAEDSFEPAVQEKVASKFEINKESLKPTISHHSEINKEPSSPKMEVSKVEHSSVDKMKPETILSVDPKSPYNEDPKVEEFVIETAAEEEIVEENLASRLVADFGLFDPTLDLSNYKFPTLDLLKEYSGGGITINQQ